MSPSVRVPLQLLVVGAVAVVLAAEPRTARATDTTVTARPDLAAEMVLEINRVRHEHGLRPLRVTAGLRRAGDAHARSMAAGGFFSHVTPRGATFGRRIRLYYPGATTSSWSAGENLLWASPDIAAGPAVQRWLESPPHRANVLQPRWTEIGAAAITAERAGGVFGGRRTTIVVVAFGTRH